MGFPKIAVDQLNRCVELKYRPERIISLVPSQTELLFDLGLEERVVGITKFCVHPKHWRQTKKRVGGTKKLNFDAIEQLAPDLIIGNKEENSQQDIEMLEKQFPVWVSDVNTLHEAYKMIEAIAGVTDVDASDILAEIKVGFQSLKPLVPQKRALYLIWKNPYMAVGSKTYINDIMLHAGLYNCVTEERYPILSEEALVNLKPEVILLSSEPFPFTEKHISPLRVLFPEAEILLVDGEMFSWYGSRLRRVPEYLHHLLERIEL